MKRHEWKGETGMRSQMRLLRKRQERAWRRAASRADRWAYLVGRYDASTWETGPQRRRRRHDENQHVRMWTEIGRIALSLALEPPPIARTAKPRTR